MTPDRLKEIKDRLAAATPGPWKIWNGPEYCGGGADLCIGAGETWLANMDHRYGIDREKRVEHDHEVGIGQIVHDDPSNCDICSISDEVTREQRANAELISHAPQDIADLINEIERLKSILP